MSTTNINQRPLCVVCHKADQVKSLPAAYDAGLARFAPPPMPVATVSMRAYMCVGIVIVTIGVFFIFVLSGSNSIGLVQVVLTMIGILVTLGLSFIAFTKLVQGDSESQQRLPAWDQAIENWSRLLYCSRDDAVFDSQTHQTVSEKALASLLSTEVKKSQRQKKGEVGIVMR